jgi:hypothetical protein
MSIENISNYLEQYQNRFYRYSHEEHIERWVNQFKNQDVVLSELSYIMDSLFFTEENENDYLKSLINDGKIISDLGEVGSYSILNIQINGQSQKIYADKLKRLYFYEKRENVPINDYSKKTLIYVDDFMFTGGRARHDVLNHLNQIGASKKIVYIFIGVHTYADYSLKQELEKQNISKSIWRSINLENRVYYKNTSDVIWPKKYLSLNSQAQKYCERFSRQIEFRDDSSTSVGNTKIFSSSQNRDVIEEEFLMAGISIVNNCNTKIKPLGNSPFDGLGFGGLAMSYRNIPNNTPLCLWWGNPNSQGGLGNWYPLMMRKVYD